MNNEYIIRFSSLKDGVHEFDYTIGKEFFEHIDYSEVKNAKLEVNLFLEKTPTMMILNFGITGQVEVMCDMCTDDFYIDIETFDEIIYRFGNEDLGDEKIIVIYPNEIEIDITHPMYEFISLAIPSRRVHEDKNDCNKDMLKDISNYLLVDDDSSEAIDDIEESKEIDPRWSALNKLKNK
jgi:uncharacterized metal-binding protein YceD (DUF177 family)